MYQVEESGRWGGGGDVSRAFDLVQSVRDRADRQRFDGRQRPISQAVAVVDVLVDGAVAKGARMRGQRRGADDRWVIV